MRSVELEDYKYDLETGEGANDLEVPLLEGRWSVLDLAALVEARAAFRNERRLPTRLWRVIAALIDAKVAELESGQNSEQRHLPPETKQ